MCSKAALDVPHCLQIIAITFLCMACSEEAVPFAENRSIQFKVATVYETAVDGVEIGLPRYIDFDDDGNMYMLDVLNRKVRIWNREGRYVKSFGGRGEGPGEFKLEKMVGDIAIFKDHVLVVDETAARVHYFDLETHEYRKTVDRPPNMSRLYLFDVANRMYALNISTSDMVQEILMLTDDLQVERVIFSAPYKEFEWIDEDRFIYRPHSNNLRTFSFDDRLVVGQTRDNLFRVFDENGDQVDSFRVPFVQRDVTEEDKAFQRKMVAESMGDRNVEIQFYDKVGFFDTILATRDLFLLVDYDEYDMSGIAYEKDGFKRIGPFREEFGDLSYLAKYDDQVLVVCVNTEGEYDIRMYDIVLGDS